MKTIVAFDFDGTLTDRDTFVEFIKFSRGFGPFLFGFMRFLPLLVLMKMGFYPNWKAKQRVFAHFYRGMSVETFDAFCRAFCQERLPMLLRPSMLRKIAEYTEQEYELCIVSASIDRWIRPWAQETGFSSLFCTEVEVENEVLTGAFLTANCYGQEKVNRLSARYPERKKYRLIAYGDSRGDRELLAFADESYYRVR